MNSKLKSFDLSGKVAVVTGATGFLGIEHCLALHEVGARVIATDIRELSGSSPLRALEIPFELMDVTVQSSIEKVRDKILTKWNRIDILVNNAAIDPKVSAGPGIQSSSRLENFSLEEWNNQLNVGLTGAFLCAKIFGAVMAAGTAKKSAEQNGSAQAGGVIVNIASDLSVIAPDQRLYQKTELADSDQPVKPVTYSVIKTGLIGLTRYLASYWADKNIRVNALSPGGIYNQQNEEFVRKLSQLIPLGRMAKKDEYRSALQFLCSDASSYMTGQNLVMDGGRSVI